MNIRYTLINNIKIRYALPKVYNCISEHKT